MPRRKVQDTRTRRCLLCRHDLPLRRFLAGDGGRGAATRCRDCLTALQANPPPSRQYGHRRATTCRYCPRERGRGRIASCTECVAVYYNLHKNALFNPATLQRRLARIREILEDHGPLGSAEIATELGISKRWALWALSRSDLPRTLVAGQNGGREGRYAIWSLPGTVLLPQPGIDLAGLPNSGDSFNQAVDRAAVRLRAQVRATVRQLVVDGRPVTPAGQRYLDSVTTSSAAR